MTSLQRLSLKREQEKQRERAERERVAQERERRTQELAQRGKQRQQQRHEYFRRNKRGQPLMKVRIQGILEKLQKEAGGG